MILKSKIKNVLNLQIYEKGVNEMAEKSSRRNHTLSIRKKDSPEFLKFIDMQDNLNDSLRVLIYRDIKRHGGARNISKDLENIYNE